MLSRYTIEVGLPTGIVSRLAKIELIIGVDTLYHQREQEIVIRLMVKCSAYLRGEAPYRPDAAKQRFIVRSLDIVLNIGAALLCYTVESYRRNRLALIGYPCLSACAF